MAGMILQHWQPLADTKDPAWGFALIDQQNQGASLAVLVAMIGVSLLSAIQNIIVLYKKR